MKRLIKCFITFFITLNILSGTLLANATSWEGSSDVYNFKITGTENYDYAFEILEILNEMRKEKGLCAWEMDKECLENAMERAAEISIYFEHDRPNDIYGYSENIACLQNTPESVMDSWKNSEGHYNNMMSGAEASSSELRIGIGCFKDNNDNYHWVQIFSSANIGRITVTKDEYSGIKDVTRDISVMKSLIDKIDLRIQSTEHKQNPTYTNNDYKEEFYTYNTESYTRVAQILCGYTETPINPAVFTWYSNDSNVVSIDQNGQYTLKNTGTATLSAVLKEDTTISFEKNITVQPQDISWATAKFSLDNYTFIYDNTPKTPKVINTLGLIEGKDYTVNYENNIDIAVGENRGKVTITGMGNYTGSVVLRFFIEQQKCEHNYVEVRTEPTCQKLGNIKMICSKCGETDPGANIVLLSKVPHNYTASITKASTCTTSGIKTYTCSMCRNSYTETIPATGHKYSSDWTIDVSPTCSAEGSKSHHCTVCGAKKDTTMIPKSEHNYSAKITKAATCTASGIKTYTCSMCSDSYTETIPAAGHSYESWTTTKPAACTTDGTMTRKCSACGKTETQTIAKTGHKYITTVIKAATCTENGENKVFCSECGERHTESVSSKGHNFSTHVLKPSYTAQGYTIHTCSTCGDSYKDNYTDKLVTPNISKVNFTASSNTVTMSWDKVPGATGYRVYKYNTSTHKWQGVANTKNTSYTFTKLNSSTAYSFTVRAYTTENGKNYLSPKYATFNTTTNPANITKVNFTSSANSVKMSWSKVSGATGYRVYQYNTSTKKWKAVANISGTSYTFKNLKAGTTYKFTVRAYKTLDGQTYFSPKYSTFTTSTNPATVNFKLTAGSKKATVKWHKVTGATGYKVYYKTSKNGSWKCLKTVSNKTTSYTKTGLTKGKAYYFTVKAYRSVGDKAYNGRYTAKSVKVK